MQNDCIGACLWLVFLLLIMCVGGNWGKALIGTSISLLFVGIAMRMPLRGPVVNAMNYFGKRTLIIYLAHNIFLPPRLPQNWDAFLSQQTLIYLITLCLLSAVSCCGCALLGDAIKMNRFMALLFLGKISK